MVIERWLYGMTLAIDANFRLKRKERGVKDDPELGPGWAYFVEDSSYKAELDGYREETEVGATPFAIHPRVLRQA